MIIRPLSQRKRSKPTRKRTHLLLEHLEPHESPTGLLAAAPALALGRMPADPAAAQLDSSPFQNPAPGITQPDAGYSYSPLPDPAPVVTP